MARLRKKILIPLVSTTSTLFFQTPAFAQSKINEILTSGISTFNTVIGLLFAIATLAFLWGMVRYIASAGDEKAKGESRRLITWGIIGLALMASAWGIVQILVEYLDIPSGGIRTGY